MDYRAAGAVGVAISLVWVFPAAAQQEPSGQAAPAARSAPTPGQTGSGAEAAASPEAPTGLWERSNLLGDIFGLRTALDRYGISFGLTETSEVLGNPTGGRAQGAVYEGATEMSVGIDLEKAVGLPGGIFNASAFQIHGRGLSLDNIDNLNIVSTIEAERSTRLFELWYQQSVFGGKADIRIGEMSADQEFLITTYGSLFINATFGWPTLPAVDLPSGGPAYPLSTPGVRFRVQPTEAVTGLLGVFNGSPAGLRAGDPQMLDASGTNFNLNSGVFVIGEVQYAINQGDDAKGLPGTYKLGAWYNSNNFNDPFFTVSDTSVGGPFAAQPSARRGDWSVYGVVDQLVFRPAGAKQAGAGVFLRVMGAPGDRNLVNAFINAGVSYKGAFGRDNDTVGLGVEWARISDRARSGDQAFAALTGLGPPIRSSETVLELTYQAQLAPWWQMQPDFQYVFNPSGGISNPDGSARRVGNAAILGLRTVVTF